MGSLIRAFPQFLHRFLREPHIVILRMIQCLVVWHVRPSTLEEMREAQAIVALAASDLDDDDSSPTNYLLADLADWLHGLYRIPIFAQGEVGRLCKSRVRRTRTIFEMRSLPGYIYPSSHGVMLEQLPWFEESNCNRIIAVAYTHYLWRVVMMFRKAGFTVYVPSMIPSAWWQKGAEQRRHRTPFTGVPFEVMARLYFLYMGWI